MNTRASLRVGSPDTKGGDMSISGTWYNELGSKMTIAASGSSVSGIYETAVGASGMYQLTGRMNPIPYSGSTSQAVAWAVAWNNPYGNHHSATAWSGQYQVAGANEQISTLWYLASETPPSDDWQSTLAGKDVFTKTPPSAADIEAARKLLTASHPTTEPDPGTGVPED